VGIAAAAADEGRGAQPPLLPRPSTPPGHRLRDAQASLRAGHAHWWDAGVDWGHRVDTGRWRRTGFPPRPSPGPAKAPGCVEKGYGAGPGETSEPDLSRGRFKVSTPAIGPRRAPGIRLRNTEIVATSRPNHSRCTVGGQYPHGSA
jgi:hypothetical protein